MANCAQLINCLNSLYLAHEDKFCVTPVGHVFGMYAAHQGGQSLRTIFSAPAVHYQRDANPASLAGLRGSASLHDKVLVLTAVNPNVSEACKTEIAVPGATIRSATVTTLTAPDIHAHNSFQQRDVVVPQTKSIDSKQGDSKQQGLTFSFPAASVTKLTLTLQ
jgi:alpha-N-arabinofuranosidase